MMDSDLAPRQRILSREDDDDSSVLIQAEMGRNTNSEPSLERRNMKNVLLLGVSFLLVFTAFQTMGNIQQTLVQSIQSEYEKENKTDFAGANGYTSQSIIYASFAVFNWIAPSVVSVIGPKMSMFLGSIPYALFVGSFLIPMTWLLYLTSAILGFGAAVIWTGQGNYLTLCSNDATMTRNSGIFWALMQSSFLIGNIFVFFVFAGADTISYDIRMVTVGVLFGVGALGTLFILFLNNLSNSSEGRKETSALGAFKNSVSLFFTKEMLLLSLTFAYTGISLSFLAGVYSTCIGNTLAFGDMAKQLVGLSGMFIGVGEIVGGLLFSIFGKKTARWGQDPIVLFGFVTHVVGFFIVFLNIPADANMGPTDTEAFITPNAFLAIFCSFLIGFGDSCFNTQIYSLIGIMYSEDSAPAFMLFKFVQSIASAISFFYTPYTSVHIQLLIIGILAFSGTVTFWIVCFLRKRSLANSNSTIAISTE
ncbi:UNC93-like protein MFSD11 isoform X2 [Artemia franciscana]|uniref:UNC93-like protein MFSD11 n=1 Tax=Artemia franciscana TaxID=6661 RepID=A0AA88KXB3_ARTSF|nr:hypothetical protein QYM36_012200 [Artemia franciscana]